MIFASPFDLAALAALSAASTRVAEATAGKFPALSGATKEQRAAIAARMSRIPYPSAIVLGYDLSPEDQARWRACHAALRAALSREVVPRPPWLETIVGYEAGAFGSGPQVVLMYDILLQALTACWVSQHGGNEDVMIPVAQFVRAADYALSRAIA